MTARPLWLVLLFLLSTLAGCGVSGQPSPPAAPTPLRVATPRVYADAPASSGGIEDICKIDPAACPRLDQSREGTRTFREPLYAIQQTADSDHALSGPLAAAPAARGARSHRTMAAPVAPAPPAAIPVQAARSARVELFDIEAKVQIEVVHIQTSRTKVLDLVRAIGGQVMNEAVEDGEERRGAALSLRVPSERVLSFLASLNSVGKVRSSVVETKEISRSIADAEVLLENLEQSLQRYQELLAKAANVAEATQIEGELARVRTQLDRVRSDLEWSKDRVARSTVYVTLALADDYAPSEPEAKLHPGVRALLLVDVPPGSSGERTATYAGGGLSLAWPRVFSIDLDLLTSLSNPEGRAIDFYLLTIGTELYSDFLGGGRNTAFNPYLGLRTGYARGPGQSYFPIGATLGVDLYKSQALLLAVETRLYALIGRVQGPDFGLEPGVGFNVAY